MNQTNQTLPVPSTVETPATGFGAFVSNHKKAIIATAVVATIGGVVIYKRSQNPERKAQRLVDKADKLAEKAQKARDAANAFVTSVKDAAVAPTITPTVPMAAAA